MEPSEDLVEMPALAVRPDVAAAILFYRMTEGWFTGRKVDDYFPPGRSDPKGARRIINGTDCDALIAGYPAQFRAALIASVRVSDPALAPKERDPLAPMANTASSPPGAVSFPPELHSQPAPSGGLCHAPSPAPAAPAFWSRLHTLMSRKAA